MDLAKKKKKKTQIQEKKNKTKLLVTTGDNYFITTINRIKFLEIMYYTL